MTGMVLDRIQQTTRTPSTKSLSKTGSQKSDFLDGFPHATNPSDANTSTVMTHPVMNPLFESGLFNYTPHE